MNREEIFNVTTRRSLRPVIQWLDDPSISEILINGPQDIYIERNGLLEKTGASFDDEESLNTAARNIAQYVNKRITPQTARLDARLPDGSRVHMVFPRCARIGVCLAIRKFGRQAFSLDYLVKAGSLVAAAREYIELMVALGRNLIVSGGTGTQWATWAAIENAMFAAQVLVAGGDADGIAAWLGDRLARLRARGAGLLGHVGG